LYKKEKSVENFAKKTSLERQGNFSLFWPVIHCVFNMEFGLFLIEGILFLILHSVRYQNNIFVE
jgi:hypothetical protein